jgi:hypothetical protein
MADASPTERLNRLNSWILVTSPPTCAGVIEAAKRFERTIATASFNGMRLPSASDMTCNLLPQTSHDKNWKEIAANSNIGFM